MPTTTTKDDVEIFYKDWGSADDARPATIVIPKTNNLAIFLLI
jgi:hypothetical protein